MSQPQSLSESPDNLKSIEQQQNPAQAFTQN